MVARTEQQPYDVLETYPAFELRRYPEHLVAETEVGGVAARQVRERGARLCRPRREKRTT